ncbi:MAG TPA: hypothetical protein VMB71_15015, partial [Acetobacteraceae bacterium]|nr:hypothetical protein [Acetobacteraceae bacterium]
MKLRSALNPASRAPAVTDIVTRMSELIKPTVASRLAAARLRFDEGDIAGAADEAAALCRERPDNVSALALHARCAVRAQDWEAAADRWRRCLAAKPPQGMARVAVQGLVKALTELDQFTEAEALWQSMRAANPADATGIAGLAAVVARRGDAAAAADLWRLAIATAAGSEPAWQLGLARAQAACGDATAAIVTTQDLLRQSPGFRPAMGFLCQMLVQQNCRTTAMAELADGVFAGSLAAVSERLRLLLWLEHMDNARAVFDRALAVAEKVEDFSALFPHIPRLYEPA